MSASARVSGKSAAYGPRCSPIAESTSVFVSWASMTRSKPAAAFDGAGAGAGRGAAPPVTPPTGATLIA